ncbi:MAG TPA: hypothetical protein ENK72_00670 [Epsilonproteobacteria bacterium]|nr:hypothetical protein [Campylobacterota bacterium]
MRLIALLFFPLLLLAELFPTHTETTVKEVSEKGVILSKPLPYNGMSGVVVRDYTPTLPAIIKYIAQTADTGKATFLESETIPHEDLPTIQTSVKPGDKVIGGYLYNNVLVLAPNAETYAKFTAKYQKNWIHPDTFSLYLATIGEQKPTKENLQNFSKAHHIGLVVIIKKEGVAVLDPISSKFITKGTVDNLPGKGLLPFFTRLDKQEAGWFDSEPKGDYYKIMGGL